MEWIDRFFEELTRPSWSAPDRCLEPLIEIQDRENEVIVTVDLPYVEKKEDISLNVTEDSLEIKAEMRCGLRWERWGTTQKEIEFKSFRKVIRLPEKVDPSGATAVFRRGILRVNLPKARRGYRIRVE